MIRKYILLPLLILACGCQAVFFKDPLTPQDKTSQDKGLHGIWMMTDNDKKLFLLIRAQDDKLLNIQAMDNEFKYDPKSFFTAYPSALGEEKFLNILLYEKDKTPDFYIIAHYAYDNNNDRLIIRFFEYEVFMKAVQDKALKGTISMVEIGKTKSPSKILITDTPGNVIAFLKGKKKEDYLGEKFMVLDRVK